MICPVTAKGKGHESAVKGNSERLIQLRHISLGFVNRPLLEFLKLVNHGECALHLFSL